MTDIQHFKETLGRKIDVTSWRIGNISENTCYPEASLIVPNFTMSVYGSLSNYLYLMVSSYTLEMLLAVFRNGKMWDYTVLDLPNQEAKWDIDERKACKRSINLVTRTVKNISLIDWQWLTTANTFISTLHLTAVNWSNCVLGSSEWGLHGGNKLGVRKCLYYTVQCTCIYIWKQLKANRIFTLQTIFNEVEFKSQYFVSTLI